MTLNISHIHTSLAEGAKFITCEFRRMKLCSSQVGVDILLILWGLTVFPGEAQAIGHWIPNNRLASLSCLLWAPLKFPQTLLDTGLGQTHTSASTAKAQLFLDFSL